LKEWTTPDSRNPASTTNLQEEEIVDAPGNDGNASMPERVKRPNPWRKKKKKMMRMMMLLHTSTFRNVYVKLVREKCYLLSLFVPNYMLALGV
jgi:hypothetical protein